MGCDFESLSVSPPRSPLANAIRLQDAAAAQCGLSRSHTKINELERLAIKNRLMLRKASLDASPDCRSPSPASMLLLNKTMSKMKASPLPSSATKPIPRKSADFRKKFVMLKPVSQIEGRYSAVFRTKVDRGQSATSSVESIHLSETEAGAAPKSPVSPSSAFSAADGAIPAKSPFTGAPNSPSSPFTPHSFSSSPPLSPFTPTSPGGLRRGLEFWAPEYSPHGRTSPDVKRLREYVEETETKFSELRASEKNARYILDSITAHQEVASTSADSPPASTMKRRMSNSSKRVNRWFRRRLSSSSRASAGSFTAPDDLEEEADTGRSFLSSLSSFGKKVFMKTASLFKSPPRKTRRLSLGKKRLSSGNKLVAARKKCKSMGDLLSIVKEAQVVEETDSEMMCEDDCHGPSSPWFAPTKGAFAPSKYLVKSKAKYSKFHGNNRVKRTVSF